MYQEICKITAADSAAGYFAADIEDTAAAAANIGDTAAAVAAADTVYTAAAADKPAFPLQYRTLCLQGRRKPEYSLRSPLQL